MARNEEKALTLFSKWQSFKTGQSVLGSKKTIISSECNSIQDAEKIRRDIIRDITKQIALISNNASLGEHRIREINDDINKKMKTKHYWDIKIRELGGVDAKKIRNFYDIEGKELPGVPGYKYYGLAKELPGIRELFAEEEDMIKERKKIRSRADLYKNITPDYYGYRDDDDGILILKESLQEKQLIARANKEYTDKRRKILSIIEKGDTSSLTTDDFSMIEEDNEDSQVFLLAQLENMNKFENNHSSSSSSSSSTTTTDKNKIDEETKKIEEQKNIKIQEELIELKKKQLLSTYLS